ncbi:phage tail assembly chaperone [Methylobacterium sp. Leaf85]|uniref:phage tail assembly chaperone n=1 Tax=Methylobacterium sp. Leaf85 TaxID=1736241 RepID=UPI0006F2F6E8|nr:hypothetical protein [Methylobacterium sp. Leaf85]KQO49944.1 hypothetical protein ASF08_22665 [Methylobacterium sp. Leaf85]
MATEKKIGSVVYRCDKLPAEDGLKLYLRMNTVFAGDAMMIGTIASDDPVAHARTAFLQGSMGQTLDADAVASLIKEAVGLCRVGSDPAILGVKPQTMEEAIDVAWYALGVQFRDFIVAGLAKA